VQHFFVLFEILRSLFADVDVNVRNGSKLLDKKLKEVVVEVIKSGSFTADACVPIHVGTSSESKISRYDSQVGFFRCGQYIWNLQ
jgi:hypothetical protein